MSSLVRLQCVGSLQLNVYRYGAYNRTEQALLLCQAPNLLRHRETPESPHFFTAPQFPSQEDLRPPVLHDIEVRSVVPSLRRVCRPGMRRRDIDRGRLRQDHFRMGKQCSHHGETMSTDDKLAQYIDKRGELLTAWCSEPVRMKNLAEKWIYIRVGGDKYRPVSIHPDNPCGCLKRQNGSESDIGCNELLEAALKDAEAAARRIQRNPETKNLSTLYRQA